MGTAREIRLSVILPCLNEEECIGGCISRIRDILDRERLSAEIIVVDNGSTDRSASIAREAGARVVEEPVKGYGAAYLRGLREARGKNIFIADSDNTYDFSYIPEFLKALDAGHDFVIGSRFRGTMEKGAMPWMNRYIGNPILSGMCRLFFRTRLSDIHCGMRAFTAEAYRKMVLLSPGMEFATEMVVTALQNNLKMAEIPIDYGRRTGKSKLMPFYDAWRHVRFMLLYCPLWLYFVPGLTGLFAGLAMLLLLLRGPVLFMGHYWDTHLAVVASALSILSFQLLNLGVFARLYAVEKGFLKPGGFIAFFTRYFTLERSIFAGFLLFAAGAAINLLIFFEWFSRHFGALYRIRESVFAMTLLIIGLQIIFSSFFVGLLFLRRQQK